MVFKKSPSGARSAPKAKEKLATFAAQVAAAASGHSAADGTPAPILVSALNRRDVMRCSQLWNKFAQQVGSATEQKQPAFRVLPPSQDLPPLA